MASEYEDRKRLSFEQAEGAEPLPSQLHLKEVSQELRALLWAVFYERIDYSWSEIACSLHVDRDHQPLDEFSFLKESLVRRVKTIILEKDYIQIFGFVQWVLRNPHLPERFGEPPLHKLIEDALHKCRAAYAVFDRDTIVPIASEAEREALDRASVDLAASEFGGARSHLRNAGSELTAGNYGPSIRESIHAVEAVARVLAPEAQTLGPALSKLEKLVRIHPALRNGFSNLYGFTSDEKGIRHALLDEPVAQVDETDALYMLGSCAAFVSYLINKARQAGLLGAAI
jgi:hypothetical protein